METSSKPSAFGSCCKDLKDSMTIPDQKFLWEDKEGVFYLTIGGVQTENGMGWMDHAVLFCPFCGARLQTEEEIRLKAGALSPHIQ